MAAPELIYCADGNRRFAEIAIRVGFTYGAQLPNTVYFAPEFVDQDWERPNLIKYLEAITKLESSPRFITVLDWERDEQLTEVLDWAEAVAPLALEAVVVIPKIPGSIEEIPDRIGGRPVVLGYSVPTSHGGTPVPTWEFGGRPVHVLGGSPVQQYQLWLHGLNVRSVDGNYHLKMARYYNQFFVPSGNARYARNRFWPTLREADGRSWGDGSPQADAPYEAFRRSCAGIMAMWRTG